METEKKGGKFNRGLAIAVLVAMLGGAGYLVFSWCYFYWNAAGRKNSDMIFLWQLRKQRVLFAPLLHEGIGLHFASLQIRK